MVTRLRFIFQLLFFTLLTYGGRIGIHLSYALPCFSCPYVSGCGGGCYLMALQGSWWGMQMATASLMSQMGIDALLYLGLFLLLSIVLGKFWCGWICPFGTLQDWITRLRKRLGIAEARMRWLTRDRLKWIKYLLLAYLIVIPLLIAHAGLHHDFGLPFCQICPAKPLMPLFAGITRHLALDATNGITLTFSILSLVIAGSMLVGMFFKERFFCWFCPMLVLIHMVRKISPVRLVKDVDGCIGCANCRRLCPMDIRRVHEEKETSQVLDEDCTLCMTCTEACPGDQVLKVTLFKWPLFSSSSAYATRRFVSSGKGLISLGERNKNA